MNFEEEVMFTGGRDGSIFRTILSDSSEEKQSLQICDAKHMITCLRYDSLNDKLWYGTPQSTLHCLDLKTKQSHLDIPGLPWLTDYSILRNKRYVLTNSQSPGTDQPKQVQLWSVETGQVVKQWQSKTFQQVQSMLNELAFDTPSTIQVPVPATPNSSKTPSNM